MSRSKLTKDRKGLMMYSQDSSIAQKETQYSDRASKQLAEDVFAKNRAEKDHSRSKAPMSKNESEPECKTETKKAHQEEGASPSKAKQLQNADRWSFVNVPSSQENTVHAPLIHDYYNAGSPSLRDYIERSYLPWKQLLGVHREAMEAKLKMLLDRVKAQGTIEYLEWGTVPLPQEVVYREQEHGVTEWWFEDLVGCVGGAKQMDEDVRMEEQRKLREALERKDGELQELREELRRKERAMREPR